MPAYTSSRWSTRSSSTSSSSYDEHSAYSASTTPTVHSTRPSERSHYHNSDVYSHRPLDEPEYSLYEGGLGSAERTSVETYASSSHSAEDFEDGLPPYDVPDYESEPGVPSALASTPSEFASYFPSTRKMSIKHDDSTVDGNMNLRIDTLAEMSDGTRGDLTLFHLRMHDLRSREFSLRRHCRDSGREICHSTRKYQKPSFMRNPGFKRSMSSALFSLRPHSADGKPTNANLKRQDSGYDSLDETSTQAPSSPQISPQIRSVPRPTNTTILDFSNYSHLEVKRRGAGTSKRYEFRYWGTSYAWRRVATSFGDYKEISYHLVDTKTSASIAHIVPVPLSQSESREEDAKGGYVHLSHSPPA